MRIVTYAEMKLLPVNTVFYRMGGNGGCVDVLDGPFRKDCDSENDIFFCTIGPSYYDRGYDKQRPFEHFTISNGGTREGLFEEDAKYLVMSPEDIALMIKNLLGVIGDDEESMCPVI